jgi:hypothetical protein
LPRRYLDQEGRQLRDDFELRKWFGSDPEIRVRYFTEIDHTIETLKSDEGDPPDATVVKMLANMCESDGSFESHCIEQNRTPIPWKELRETGAAVAFEAHVREREALTWP